MKVEVCELMDKLGIAIIGCGRISYKHIEAVINNHEQIALISTCDIIQERAVKKASEYKEKAELKDIEVLEPEVYTDYKKLLNSSKVQIVAIATESGKHAAIALDCIKAGKHVIVEKPIALSTKDADEVIKAAEDMQVKLCVSHQNRFNPAIQKLRTAIESGRFGRIFAGNARILWNRNKDYYEQANWRGTYEQDGGCLMNQCIHNIDLLQWMLGGEIEMVHGMTDNYLHPYIEAEDYGSIQIRFKNSAIGNIEGTVSVYPKNLEETLTVLGEKGTVVIGGTAVNNISVWQFADNQDNLEQVQQECNQEIENIYGAGHTPLYKNMIESINKNKKPYIDGYEGKKAMQIVLCAYRSQFTGERTKYEQEISTCDFR